MTSDLSNASAMASAGSGQRVHVDTHLHVFKAGLSLPGTRYTPGYDAKLDTWRIQARSVGVTHGVLVQTSFMGTDNRWLLTQLALHPKRLRGVAVVAPNADAKLLTQLHARGVRGIRLNLAGQSHDMAAWAAATGLWDALLQLGWHVELHTDNGRLPEVLPALPAHLPLVLDHFARPASASMHDPTVATLRQRQQSGGKVHIKLSASYRLAVGLNPAALCQLWQVECGLDALLWGSDWPFTNHETTNNYASQHGGLAGWLKDDVLAEQAVRSANPARLYGFGTG